MKKIISKLTTIWTYLVSIPVTLIMIIIGIIVTTILNLSSYALALFGNDTESVEAYNDAFEKMFHLTKIYSNKNEEEKSHLVNGEEW